MDIKGVLFDSGDTLVFPKSGAWWPGPEFESILLRHGIDTADFDADTMRLALDEGYTFLDNNHLVLNLEEEKEQFRTYYRVICDKLGIIKDDGLIEDLMRAYVEECNFRLYPDTIPVLEKLTNNDVTLGVISDAWPSLHNKYITLGIRHYFKSFTISAEVGCCKPYELIYRRAIDEIGIAPKNLLFIDDDLDNVKAAVRLGMNGIVMLRNKDADISDVPYVQELAEILDIIQ
ncbi:MAG: HAD-IA family hydrolase [Dehalococcoidales bacterium]|nr:MAG: HAD-IA family hydrolase [Dehalococcoidales bacterium]